MKHTAVGAIGMLAVLVVGLSGCGRAGSTDETTGSSTTGGTISGTVTMWALGGDSELQDFVKTFEEANPGVTVEITEVPWDSAYTKVQTAIAAGNTPDLAVIPGAWNADFGYALESVPSDFDTSRFIPGALQTSEVDGSLTGVPWALDVPVLYYRTDLAEQAGWDHAPTTWAELKELASDYISKAGTTWGMRFPGGGEGSFAGVAWLPVTNGAQLIDGDDWSFDTPEWSDAFDFWLSFYADQLSDPLAVNDLAAGLADFISGDTPMLVTGPWMVGQLAAAGGDDIDSKYATALLPKAPGQSDSISVISTSNLVVFQDAENKDAAWKLIDWFSEADNQVAHYEYAGALPAATAAWDDEVLANDAKFSVFGEQSKTSSFFPTVTTLTQIASIGDQLVEPMVRGTMTVEDALASLQQQASEVGLGE
ncbi:MAG: extracellular solute-binding protein [Protaetiibacter sp.]